MMKQLRQRASDRGRVELPCWVPGNHIILTGRTTCERIRGLSASRIILVGYVVNNVRSVTKLSALLLTGGRGHDGGSQYEKPRWVHQQ